MMVKAGDVAGLLGVEEKTVLGWVRKDGLPATLVNGNYQINRMDLFEWATEHGIKVPPELFSEAEPDVYFPTLAEALGAGGIHCNVPGEDKLTVLKNVIGLIKLPPQVDPEFLLQVLLAREALGTTAIGDGVAIPHVRNPILLDRLPSSIMLCFLRRPVDFGALDGLPVRILFLLTSSTVKVHLHLLSKLAYALSDEGFKSSLKLVCDPGGIISAAAKVEKEIGR
ncbi:MAG: PTS sugar transporter subunit IIA [Nitrospirae bacterium]|nr:PTS sugar transporter subunit IIA [Nitrospirota bacterium]